LAEGVGFEPTGRVNAQRFSSGIKNLSLYLLIFIFFPLMAHFRRLFIAVILPFQTVDYKWLPYKNPTMGGKENDD